MSRLRLLLGARAGQVIPPDPGDYPASVIAKSLQAVWDLQTTAGRTQSYLKKLGEDTLPAGWNWDGDILAAPTTGSPLLDRWDLTGASINITGSNDVGFQQCGFTGSPPAGAEKGRTMRINASGGLARVYIEDCSLDGENSLASEYESMISNFGRLYLTRTRFANASKDFVSSYSSNNNDPDPVCELHITDVYAAGFGQRGGVADHYEPFHGHCGLMNLLRVFVDNRVGCDLTPVASGVTAILGYPQPRQGVMTWSFEECIALDKEVAGVAAPQSAYNTYTNNGVLGGAVGVINNCVLSKGTSKHVEADGSTITGSGNIDFYTSAAITDAGLTA